jgi:hypothetical protein
MEPRKPGSCGSTASQHKQLCDRIAPTLRAAAAVSRLAGTNHGSRLPHLVAQTIAGLPLGIAHRCLAAGSAAAWHGSSGVRYHKKLIGCMGIVTGHIEKCLSRHGLLWLFRWHCPVLPVLLGSLSFMESRRTLANLGTIKKFKPSKG